MSDVRRGRETPGRFRKSALSIRGRLIVIALLAVVPLMVDRVRLLENSRTDRIENAHSEVMALTRRGLEMQREVVDNVRTLMQVMARSESNILATGTACSRTLSELRNTIAWLNGLSIVGANGRILCSSTGQGIGLDLSDRDYFRTALATGNFAVSPYLIDRVRHRPAMIAAQPMKATDGETRIIVAAIDLTWVDRLIATVSQRQGTAVLVTGSDGRLLAAHPLPQDHIGESVAASPLIKQMLARREGMITSRGIDGVPRIFAFAPIAKADAFLAVGLDERAVLQRIEHEIGTAYIQLGLFGLMVLLVAWFGGERLIGEPIRLLARTAQRFGRGDLDTRTMREEWAAEFVPLASALSEMATKLGARDREQREANERLAELASMDALSRLANRRGFDARLTAEWQTALTQQTPLALLMIDVDHFKPFNDHYGHVEGDACLRDIAHALRQAAGAEAFAARYGGEEFALLLPNTDLDTALATGEHLRQAIEALQVAHAAAPDGQVTVSVGVAALVPGPGDTIGQLVEAADAGLYAAKRRGRNAVVAHSELEPLDPPALTPPVVPV